jgi:hypothetical protein
MNKKSQNINSKFNKFKIIYNKHKNKYNNLFKKLYLMIKYLILETLK